MHFLVSDTLHSQWGPDMVQNSQKQVLGSGSTVLCGQKGIPCMFGPLQGVWDAAEGFWHVTRPHANLQECNPLSGRRPVNVLAWPSSLFLFRMMGVVV